MSNGDSSFDAEAAQSEEREDFEAAVTVDDEMKSFLTEVFY